MVSASSSLSVGRTCVQILRECESLKLSIQGKSSQVADVFSDEFIVRQSLESHYKQILLSDVQFALDNKVELELWNRAFKEHIDSFRKYMKSSNEKSDYQVKLSVFIDMSIGFYFQLLQEFCDVHDLDLPYHGKGSQLGILREPKEVQLIKPKSNACFYICQDCLVHLGDLARYRNNLKQAASFYKLASKLLPGNGQPYNQLAILSSAVDDSLHTVFYYCKSISVPNPFPAAASNLHKIFNQIYAKHNHKILSKPNVTDADDFIDLFIYFNGCIYIKQDIPKLAIVRDKLLQDIKEILLELTQQQVILIAGICIFTLDKNKHNDGECITENESSVWHLILSLSVGIFQAFIEISIEMLFRQPILLEDMKFLPGVKLLFDWIISCNVEGLFEEEQFQENPELFNQLTVFGNELQKICTKHEKSALPLIEDWEMHGVIPLRRIHRRYDFAMQPLKVNLDQTWFIRVTRILNILDSLTLKQQVARFITKEEGERGTYKYICLVQQKASTIPNKSERARSLFRTESEEFGMAVVQGPIASSYSLFDTMWSASLHSTPADEVKKHVDSTADISTLHMKDTPFMNQQPPRLPLSSTIYEGQVVSQYPNIVPTNLLPAVGKIPLSGHVLNLSSSFDEVNLLQSSPTVVRPPLPMQHQLGLRVSHHDVKPNSIPIQPPFASMPNNSVHRSAFPMVEPSMRPNSIMSHSPSFGAVGQNMRGPPGLQQPVQPGHWPMGSRNVQHGLSQPRVIGPEHAMASGQSIWSSNFAIGQGELSPLEQLLQEQRRSQLPK